MCCCFPTKIMRNLRNCSPCGEIMQNIFILRSGGGGNRWEINEKERIVTSSLFCDSAAIRTQDPRLRRALLYPAELRNHPSSVGDRPWLLSSDLRCKGTGFFRTMQVFCVFFSENRVRSKNISDLCVAVLKNLLSLHPKTKERCQSDRMGRTRNPVNGFAVPRV